MSAKRIFPSLFILVITIFMDMNGTAAARIPNVSFNGKWKINLAESQHGESAPAELLLTQTADSVFIERTGADQKSFVEKLSFDGKNCSCTTTSGRKKIGTAKWDDTSKESFIETATLSDATDPGQVAFHVTEHWQLSADGKKLTEEITISNASGAQFSSKAVYERQ